MRIEGSFPLHVARAYGIQPRIVTSSPTGAVGKVATGVEVVPSAAGGGAAAAPQSGVVSQLVAGRVPGGVDFGSATRSLTQTGAFQMYTRAADRIEAATAVRVGRTVDLTG